MGAWVGWEGGAWVGWEGECMGEVGGWVHGWGGRVGAWVGWEGDAWVGGRVGLLLAWVRTSSGSAAYECVL